MIVSSQNSVLPSMNGGHLVRQRDDLLDLFFLLLQLLKKKFRNDCIICTPGSLTILLYIASNVKYHYYAASCVAIRLDSCGEI